VGRRRGARARLVVATALVVAALVGPLPLVALPFSLAPAAALVCGTAVDAATALPDAATALRAAVAAAATADGACAAWTVTLQGIFTLVAPLEHAVALPLHLVGPVDGRAELAGAGGRLVTLRRPGRELRLERLVLRDGDARGGDLDGAGGAVAAEAAPLADPTPSRVVVVDALLTGNRAAVGGAIAADHVELVAVDLVGNVAPLGGAVDVLTLVAERTTFLANEATGAPGQGGAVRAAGDVTLTTVTLAGNAALVGGSVWLAGVGRPVLRAVASTFASARADTGGHVHGDLGGGGGGGGDVRVVLRGSVLAGAAPLTPGAAAPVLCSGTVAHAGPAPDDAVASFATDASCPGAIALGTDPAFDVLDTLAGHPRLHAPRAGGPLVDTVPCGAGWPTTDARGLARPQPAGGACDAGAIELAVGGPPAREPVDGHDGAAATDAPVPVRVEAGGSVDPAVGVRAVGPRGQWRRR